jgi:uncharacterized protein YdeI (YjbR/CyaY-like superfamily)
MESTALLEAGARSSAHPAFFIPVTLLALPAGHPLPSWVEIHARTGKNMASKPLKTASPRNLLEWRRWLAAHHGSEPEVWLVFHKHHTGRASVAYEDALDEALCFGWIDSLIRRIDDERYARKFTPRKPGSRWSAINRERYARLAERGQLMPAGLARPPTERSYAPKPSIPEMPRYIAQALKKHPRALRNFEALPPSHRRHFMGWIDSAKKTETKLRRLEESLRLLAAGKRLGLK